MQVALKFGSATIPSLSSYAFFLVFRVIVYMIPEDILKTSNRIHNLDELALKFYSYINNNPGKRIAFWGHTYQTKKLIIDYEKMLNKEFVPTYIIDNFKHLDTAFLDHIPIISFEEAEANADRFDLIVIMVDSPSIYAILEQISDSRLSSKELWMVHRDTNPLTEVEFNSLCKEAQSSLVKEGVVWYTTEENWYCCYQYLKQVASLEGDVAEFGVFQGGSAYFIASVMKHLKIDKTKRLFLFDSFTGFLEKHSVDFFEQGSFSAGRGSEQIKSLLEKFYQVEVFEGDVCDTLPESGLEKLSLAHIDCDQYVPTKFLCEFLYERMVPEGIMMFQNYSLGLTYGERIAVDSFFKDKPENVLFGFDRAAFIIKN